MTGIQMLFPLSMSVFMLWAEVRSELDGNLSRKEMLKKSGGRAERRKRELKRQMELNNNNCHTLTSAHLHWQLQREQLSRELLP